MELRHLRYFVAAAEEENVTRAAARLHVSQPPLSRQIHDLESELGVTLFQRTAKSIRLTEEGRVFLAEARAVLERAEEAVRAVRAVADRKHGTLHIGYAPTPSAGILPAILRAFEQEAPAVRVKLHDLSSEELLAGVRERKLHAAFMLQPPAKKLRGLEFTTLLTQRIVAALPPHHPLSKGSRLRIEHAAREPLVGYSKQDYPDYYRWIAGILGIAPTKLRLAAECDSGMSLIAAVEAGRGICIVPESIVDAAGPRLRYLPLWPAPPRATVGVVFPIREVPPLVTRLVSAATRAMSAISSPRAA
jgi:DNA-binding transcriptional LysR family regulator